MDHQGCGGTWVETLRFARRIALASSSVGEALKRCPKPCTPHLAWGAVFGLVTVSAWGLEDEFMALTDRGVGYVVGKWLVSRVYNLQNRDLSFTTNRFCGF